LSTKNYISENIKSRCTNEHHESTGTQLSHMAMNGLW